MNTKKQNNPKKSNNHRSNPVRIVRKQLKLTQAELAERLSVEPNYISMIETGQRAITKNIAVKLHDISPPGTRLEWILGNDKYQNDTEESAAMDAAFAASLPEIEKYGEAQMMIIKKAAQAAGFNFEIRKTDKTACYCFTDSNGADVELNVDSMLEMISDISDYAAFRVNRTIKKKYNQSRVKIEM